MDDFVPRGSECCGTGWAEHPWIAAAIIAGNVAVALAYFLIPWLMVVLLRRFPACFPYRRLWTLYAAFIVACGVTHVIAALEFIEPYYRVEAVAQVGTGLLSMATVVMLARTSPAIVKSLTAASEAVKAIDVDVSNRLAKLGVEIPEHP